MLTPFFPLSLQYNGVSQVVYGGHLWTAKWWSEADTPGGAAGDWQDDGACTSFAGRVFSDSSRERTVSRLIGFALSASVSRDS